MKNTYKLGLSEMTKFSSSGKNSGIYYLMSSNYQLIRNRAQLVHIIFISTNLFRQEKIPAIYLWSKCYGGNPPNGNWSARITYLYLYNIIKMNIYITWKFASDNHLISYLNLSFQIYSHLFYAWGNMPSNLIYIVIVSRQTNEKIIII